MIRTDDPDCLAPMFPTVDKLPRAMTEESVYFLFSISRPRVSVSIECLSTKAKLIRNANQIRGNYSKQGSR